jgi:hypothetical protein
MVCQEARFPPLPFEGRSWGKLLKISSPFQGEGRGEVIKNPPLLFKERARGEVIKNLPLLLKERAGVRLLKISLSF